MSNDVLIYFCVKDAQIVALQEELAKTLAEIRQAEEKVMT